MFKITPQGSYTLPPTDRFSLSVSVFHIKHDGNAKCVFTLPLVSMHTTKVLDCYLLSNAYANIDAKCFMTILMTNVNFENIDVMCR